MNKIKFYCLNIALSLSLLFVFNIYISAQTYLELELGPKAEYRYGFKQILPRDVNLASFISQRTRLNFKHKPEHISIHTFAIDQQAKFYLPQILGKSNYNVLANPKDMLQSITDFFQRIMTL